MGNDDDTEMQPDPLAVFGASLDLHAAGQFATLDAPVDGAGRAAEGLAIAATARDHLVAGAVQHLGRRVAKQPLSAPVPADDPLPLVDQAESVGAIPERFGKRAK